MELNKEAILLQAEIKKFARDVIAQNIDKYDREYIFPAEESKKLAEMGILGATIPESYGGYTLDTVSLLLCIEEISKVSPSLGLIIATHNLLFSYPIAKYGNEMQKRKYLTGASMGEIIGGFAEFATNQFDVKIESDSYLINGCNPIVLNCLPESPFIILLPLEKDLKGVIIDGNLKGVMREKGNSTIGMHSAGISRVVFNDCQITNENLIGNGDGRGMVEEIKSLANLCLSAVNLGIAQGAMENAIKYAKERVQFNERIINFGMVREMIVQMIVKIEAMRLLIYDAAIMRDNNKDFARASAIARYFSNRSVAEITTDAIQVYGGYGYMKDYPVERYFRDAQISRVLCTSSMEQKELIITNSI